MLLLFVLGLCLSIARADVDCSKLPKIMDTRICCPLPDFFTAELKEKCQYYNLTVPPPKTMSGEINYLSPCYVYCVFEGSGIYKDNIYFESKLKAYLQVVFKDYADLLTLSTDAFIACANKFDEFKIMKTEFPSLCSSTETFFMGCAFRKIFKDCPTEFWTDTQDCSDAREHIANCKLNSEK